MDNQRKNLREPIVSKLEDIFKSAESLGIQGVVIRSGNLHDLVLGKGANSPASVCSAMMVVFNNKTDKVIQQPPKGKGRTLTISYQIPRDS